MANSLKVYIGRFSPIHLGHIAIIDQMLDDAKIFSDTLILIGSANTPQSLRHFFSYKERKDMIRLIYPNIDIAPLPDFPNKNDEWFDCILDLIILKGDYTDVQFYAGCKEDVIILEQYTKNIVYVNRFDGTTPVVSATQVRDALIHNRDLDGLMHSNVIHTVKHVFDKRWKEFQNK